jgi:uncharacterized membrane protein
VAGRRVFVASTLAVACLCAPKSPGQTGEEAVAHAVLFSSPTCPHCRVVREQVLPSLGPRFGSHLHVFIVNTTTPSGLELYYAALKHFDVKGRGVPMLIVGDSVLIGTDEIRTQLPPLVERCLARGGSPWPEVPGLSAAFALAMPARPTPQTAVVSPPAPAATPEVTVTPGALIAAPPSAEQREPPSAGSTVSPAEARRVASDSGLPSRVERHADVASRTAGQPATAVRSNTPAATPRLVAPRATSETDEATAASRPADTGVPRVEAPSAVVVVTGEDRPRTLARLAADPLGNGLAIVVLVGMIGVVLWSVFVLRNKAVATSGQRLDWLNPMLTVAGVVVAAYLAHVEVRGVQAVCGPVGDCNTVQHSEYARLLGVLPIGVLGVAGFSVILLVWLVRRVGSELTAAWASVLLLALTAGGTLFSIYLTFLEPFVIGATCLWCLSSSVLMTLLYWAALSRGREALALLIGDRAAR